MIALSPERMKTYDAYAIETWGIPSAVLMENAGRTTYRLAKATYLTATSRLAVFCGRGNNGGDGFVIARYALRDGLQTQVFLLCDPDGLKGDAFINMNLFRSMGGAITIVGSDAAPIVREGVERCDVVVDAILGTGLANEVRGVEAAVIEEINRSGKTVIAVDIPSGLDGLRGIPLGRAIRATHTYTYGHAKLGHLLHPGVTYRGRLTVVDISLPLAGEAACGIDARLVDGKMLRRIYRVRPPEAHKGMFGNVAVVAGSVGKTGAAVMATTAALKIGAGLVTLVIPGSLAAIAATKLTEAMTYPVEDGGKGFFVPSSYGAVRDFCARSDLVILGCGIGTEPETAELARRLYTELDKPFIVDADGINAFEGRLDILKSRKAGAIFTPHPGEFGRLIGKDAKEVNADRLNLGRRFVGEHGCCLVLKGAPTITFAPEGGAFINPTGNAALAKGGSGDILTGFVGGLAAQGYTLEEAAIFGVYLHGYIADTWAAEQTDMDLVAGDLPGGLGRAIRDIRNGTDRVYIEESL
ncbi:MAG: NAD(P)H-hydrate dehydratase [Syntrophorhabdales bacterium]|jgi:NAD(P)H-hydrate epimerase